MLSSNRPKRDARDVKDDLFSLQEIMIIGAGENVASVQGRYKCDHYNRVRMILRIGAVDKVFLANPPGVSHADTNRANTILQS